MRRMSFSLTTQQVLDRAKTVTRRLGWHALQPGERFLAVEKCMGLKKGQKQRILRTLECVSNTREPLNYILQRGPDEVVREGFLEMSTSEFTWMFCRHMHCKTSAKVNRIEFKYVD